MNLSFDRDVALGELLDSALRSKLCVLFDRAFHDRWQLLDAEGHCVLGTNQVMKAMVEAPLRLDFELLGKLSVSEALHDQVEQYSAWLELVLMGTYRYRMASDLHIEAINADFTALQHKHASLQESEVRYRELALSLERKVAEQVDMVTRTQRRLYQNEKMASVGSLAAGMAHEINNPIGFIRSNATTSLDYVVKMSAVLQAYRSGLKNEAEAAWKKADIDFILDDFPELLRESASGADRVARIVANLKRYASIDYAASSSVDLNESVQTVVAIMNDQLPQKISIRMDLQPLPMIVCDQGRINQMLLAIVQNAAQAIQDTGLVTVATHVSAGEIRIAVRDNGCGIAPDVLTRIFDPFFTTRGVGKGTGLGLTVGRDTAEAHGGRIEVESVPNIGSTFTVCLPLADTNTTSNAGL